MERAHALLGRTVDDGRVWDIAAISRGTVGFKQEIAVGETAILLAYAGLFAPSERKLILIKPPSSHKDGPHFLGVLRVLEIPDALGMLAPRKLTIIGAKDNKVFDKTAEIFKRAGAADKFERK